MKKRTKEDKVFRIIFSPMCKTKLGFLCKGHLWFGLGRRRINKSSEGYLGHISSPMYQGKASEGKRKATRRRSKFSSVATTAIRETKFWICNRRSKFL